jgi:hypothetical protein
MTLRVSEMSLALAAMPALYLASTSLTVRLWAREQEETKIKKKLENN